MNDVINKLDLEMKPCGSPRYSLTNSTRQRQVRQGNAVAHLPFEVWTSTCAKHRAPSCATHSSCRRRKPRLTWKDKVRGGPMCSCPCTRIGWTNKCEDEVDSCARAFR